MSRDDRLTAFVDRGLTMGHSRADLRAAMLDAGWSAAEADGALAAFADAPFVPPVPAPGGVLAARDFLFYGVLFLALSVSAIYAVDLMHDLLGLWLGEGDAWRWRDLEWSLAALIVFGPVYLWCDRRDRRRGDAAERALVRRWMASAVVLGAVVVLLWIAVWIVRALIRGGPTLLFVLEMAVVGAVAGAVLLRWRRA
jgi:hypothetical protein